MIVSFSATLSLSLSLSSGLVFRKKNEHSTLLRIGLRVSTCIIHVRGLKVNVWSVINNDLSHLGGYNRVSESSFGIVAGTCPCIKFVNAGDLE